ncbi:MAG: hypothetical protein IKC24_00085 [Oscillospiraceae bacterium]|nr:hypothetical protein [Oscillospiraceae bacterium]
MIHPIISSEKVTVGTAAVSVPVNCRSFLIKNCSTNATVYFTEYENGGGAATAETGFPLSPGETCPVTLNARTLSLIASAQADVRLLYLGEGW